VTITEGQRFELRTGFLERIQRGDRHEIRNTGDALLKSLNIYVPPAYTYEGEELSAARKRHYGHATRRAEEFTACY
jgi:hypothetical protein